MVVLHSAVQGIQPRQHKRRNIFTYIILFSPERTQDGAHKQSATLKHKKVVGFPILTVITVFANSLDLSCHLSLSC